MFFNVISTFPKFNQSTLYLILVTKNNSPPAVVVNPYPQKGSKVQSYDIESLSNFDKK
jgi:hypothetical protein